MTSIGPAGPTIAIEIPNSARVAASMRNFVFITARITFPAQMNGSG